MAFARGGTFARGMALSAVVLLGLLTACAPAAPASPSAAPAQSAQQPTAASGQSAGQAGFDEQAVASFYKGKTVRMVVGFAPGGGFDSYARLLAKHMPRHIPGNPTMIVENKPGAASMVAANSVYNLDPKDGTVIANISEGLVLQQAMGLDGIQFDAAKFQWLGNTVKTAYACMARTDSGIENIDQIIGGGKQLITGTQAPGTGNYDAPAVMNATLGTNFKLVPGYDGIAKIRLAFEQREVDGWCQTWESIVGTSMQFLEGPNPMARMLIIMGSEVPNHPALKGVPAAETLAETEETRQLLKAVNAPQEMSKPYAVAPGVPADRVAALRTALGKTFADPEFRADAEKAKLNLEPATGEQVQQIVEDVLSTPTATLARLKDILK
jgi:tripartite-type tricarboxylate transporter receptor subunit TctC